MRCWLVAGTICGGKVREEFSKKFGVCTRCDVYRDAVFAVAITEICEHLMYIDMQNKARARVNSVKSENIL